ncbi:MAG: tetratricopeptide repeat protein [Candidatus Neomarinimicrobiota bacterium]
MGKLSTLIDELRRRRVFRVAAFYGGIAFVIIQIIDGAFSYLHIPEWFGTAIIVLLLIGFPVSMILAWVFDITSEGIVRTGKAADVPAPSASGKLPTSNRALIVIAVLAVAFGIWGRWGTFSADNDLPIIAVLPFQSYSAEEDDWFADGFTDVLISQLTTLASIGVISRTSTMHYKNTTMNATEVGKELGADLVLEGSVLRSGGKVRITGQLIDTDKDRHLWASSYERSMDDVIALQSDVALAIARALKSELTLEEEQSITATPTDNPEAYDLYLKGLSLVAEWELHPGATWADRANQLDLAAESFSAALTIDPALMDAHVWLVDIHGTNYYRGDGFDPTPARFKTLNEALARVEAVAPGTVEAQKARGLYHLFGDGNYRRALEYFEPLRARYPNDSYVLHMLGLTYRRLGRWDEGLELLIQAADLNPRSPIYVDDVLDTYRRLWRYDEGQRYFERLKFMGATERYAVRAWFAIEGRGDLEEGWQILQEIYQEQGSTTDDLSIVHVAVYRRDFEAAHQVLDQATALTPRGILSYRSWTYDAEGRFSEARAAAAQYLKMLDDAQVSTWFGQLGAAFQYAIEGDSTQATRLVELFLNTMNPEVDAVSGPRALSYASSIMLRIGNLELGLDYLEQLMIYPYVLTVHDLRYYHYYDPVRSHPRFIALVEKYSGGR